MPHLVLLGDSIFDNARYTSGGPDVVSQVQRLLPSGWSASLLAVDGSTTDNISDQMQNLPDETTHLVLSVGGNNALLHASQLGISLFGIPSASDSGALISLADISEDFETRYRTAIEECLRPHLPLAVCTIYNGRFPDRTYQRIASVALTIFNDTILRVAIEHGLPVIDLRLICNEDRDYANPIEPSSAGGEKIARVIVTLVTEPETFVHATRVVSVLHNESNPDKRGS
jgi:GDSL-like lipase/acylhydrolase family protein